MTNTKKKQAEIIKNMEKMISEQTELRKQFQLKSDEKSKVILNLLKNQERLLQNLINDNINLQIYREQLIQMTRKDIKKLESVNEYALAK